MPLANKRLGKHLLEFLKKELNSCFNLWPCSRHTSQTYLYKHKTCGNKHWEVLKLWPKQMKSQIEALIKTLLAKAPCIVIGIKHSCKSLSLISSRRQYHARNHNCLPSKQTLELLEKSHPFALLEWLGLSTTPKKRTTVSNQTSFQRLFSWTLQAKRTLSYQFQSIACS